MNSTKITVWSRSLIGAVLMLTTVAHGEWKPGANMPFNDVHGQPVPDSLGHHLVDGIKGDLVGNVRKFSLTAKAAFINTPEGNSVYFWGYAPGSGTIQYPGPTLIVNAGEQVEVELANELPVSTSAVFPGQSVTSTTGGTAGLLTAEVAPQGAHVVYKFTAARPGTYLYNSGTRADLQIEMGLVGAIIVRPAGFDDNSVNTWRAYASADSGFDQEYLFLLSEWDPDIHIAVERHPLIQFHQKMQAYDAAAVKPALPVAPWGNSAAPDLIIDTAKRNANYWFINGRNAPDTMQAANTPGLPYQPYDSFPTMHPGQRLLMRVIGGGRDPHPFHHHGNHATVLARNGRQLQSPGATTSDLAYRVFTIPSYPGETTDAVYTWTGKGLGWDVYGHLPGDEKAVDSNGNPLEDDADHGKPFPVLLPTEQDMEYGLFYSGSPFLGYSTSTPPNTGGFDSGGGYINMWHSHAEREIVNYNVFPGGMLTMLLVAPWPVKPVVTP